MFGQNYGQIFYFQNVDLQKEAFTLVWRLKLASFSLLKRLSPLMLCPPLPQNKIVLAYVMRSLDDIIEFALRSDPPLHKKKLFLNKPLIGTTLLLKVANILQLYGDSAWTMR